MTQTIRIKALVPAFGLKRGDIVDVELLASTDAMIDAGYWEWIDPPTAEPELTLTEEVKKRKPKAKPVEDAVWEDEAPIDYTSFPDES